MGWKWLCGEYRPRSGGFTRRVRPLGSKVGGWDSQDSLHMRVGCSGEISGAPRQQVLRDFQKEVKLPTNPASFLKFLEEIGDSISVGQEAAGKHMGWWSQSPLILRGKMAFSSIKIISQELFVCIFSDQ